MYQLEREMPFDEFKRWLEYFKRRPYGWRDDNRSFMIMRSFGIKEKPEALFPTLAALKENKPQRVELKGTKLLSMMLKAKGGETLEL